LQTQFLSLLPRVESHARIHCHDRCRQTRDDQIAEAVALAWSWYLRLAARGIDAADFPSALATYAVKAAHSGRKLAGSIKANDVFNDRAQRRHGFAVKTLPSYGTLMPNPMTEALIDNTATPPDEQAAFRIDFNSWLRELGERDRNVALDMAVGERTADLADKYGLSRARVSQKRSEFRRGWRDYIGEA
jgi:hypothetical protein